MYLVSSFVRAGDDANLPSDGLGGDRVVACDHDHFDAGRSTPSVIERNQNVIQVEVY